MLKALWVMRHGLAETKFGTDFNRALSDKGKRQVEDVAGQILAARHEVDLDKTSLPTEMLVSPFRRTQETAEVVHKILALERPYETDDMLVHFADHQLLGDYLRHCDKSRLIIVSHMPIVAKLCQYLAPACQVFAFQTAQAVRLDFTKNTDDKALDFVRVSRIFLARDA